MGSKRWRILKNGLPVNSITQKKWHFLCELLQIWHYEPSDGISNLRAHQREELQQICLEIDQHIEVFRTPPYKLSSSVPDALFDELMFSYPAKVEHLRKMDQEHSIQGNGLNRIFIFDELLREIGFEVLILEMRYCIPPNIPEPDLRRHQISFTVDATLNVLKSISEIMAYCFSSQSVKNSSTEFKVVEKLHSYAHLINQVEFSADFESKNISLLGEVAKFKEAARSFSENILDEGNYAEAWKYRVEKEIDTELRLYLPENPDVEHIKEQILKELISGSMSFLGEKKFTIYVPYKKIQAMIRDGQHKHTFGPNALYSLGPYEPRSRRKKQSISEITTIASSEEDLNLPPGTIREDLRTNV